MPKPYRTQNNVPPIPKIEPATGGLNFFDHDNPDINLFNILDEELIRISGSQILYYQYSQGDSQYDDVYMEARNKPISSDPITLYGHYDPKVLEEHLSEFGIELNNDQVFVFNKAYIDQTIVGSLKAGDILQPKFQNQKYEIYEVQEDSFEIYGVYHLVCSAKLLRDSSDVQDTPLDKTSESLKRPAKISSIEEDYDDL